MIHTIVSTGRIDLLRLALDSVKPLWKDTVILDNSLEGRVSRMHWNVPVVRPSVPLSCAQAMNFLQVMALATNHEVFGYQHEDAQAAEGTADALLEAIPHRLNKEKWCAVFTCYDILSVYNVNAVMDIGPWDQGFPNPNYHVDIDWFYRARLLGYQTLDTQLQVTHLEGGSVTRKMPERRRAHEATIGYNGSYYQQKWGGPPHAEVFKSPWNQLEN